MTRAERLAEQVRKAKEKLVKQQREVAYREAAQREAVRKDIHKRRYLVGSLAHEAGLFAWSNTDLANMFAVLATLGDVPNPVTVLEGFLDLDGTSEVGTLSGDLAEITLARRGLEKGETEELAACRASPFQGVLYVVQMDGHPWLKIGFTSGGLEGLCRRIAFLQTGCPLPLRVRKAYSCELPDKLESHVHMALAPLRRTGEWFETDLEAIEQAVRTLWSAEWDRYVPGMTEEQHGGLGSRTNGL